MHGSIDMSIFEAAYRAMLESKSNETFSVGPYKYQDFNLRTQNLLDKIVIQINRKYNMHYDPRTAFDIEDNGCPRLICIGLKNSLGEAKHFFMFNYGNDGVISCSEYYERKINYGNAYLYS